MTDAIGQISNQNVTAKKEQSNIPFLAGSTLINSAMGAGVGGAFAYFPKIDEDEFVKIGQKLDVVKDKVANKEDIETGLKDLFNGAQKDDIIKMMKKEKAKTNAKFGAIIFALGGLASGLYQIHCENKAKEANNKHN